ncbi:MAG: SDR family NAD(P)-dependent oxidoreductase [Acidimicrobiia bacterium]
MNVSLSGRVVLVTGASRGIGAATAVAVATAGADVAVAYLAEGDRAAAVVNEIRSLGREADSFSADLADPGQARALVASVEERFDRIDGLVNNAGIMAETPFIDISDEEWETVLRTDLFSAFTCTQAALPGMLERGSGTVVMVSSRLGQIGCSGLAHYSAAKAGLLGLVKSLARELGPRGIRVNAVAPGVTVTEMSRQVIEGEVGKKRLAKLPAGRFATPPEVASPSDDQRSSVNR